MYMYVLVYGKNILQNSAIVGEHHLALMRIVRFFFTYAKLQKVKSIIFIKRENDSVDVTTT